MPVAPLAKRVLTVGSRGSQLALWQAQFVASQLNARGVQTRIEIIRTTGDHLQAASLARTGGKGLFTKEIEEALLRGDIDIAVHSLKDLPTEITEGLTIAAVPEREDPRDAILGHPLHELVDGSRIGTSSGRRAAQLRILRTDLDIQPIRGNVDTRLRKLKEGQYDAIVLAAAALLRLGLADEMSGLFSPEEMCPAPGQGALAIQTRANDSARDICAALNHEPTHQAVRCERTVLAALGGGCQLPVGAFADPQEDILRAIAVVVSPDGSRHVRAESAGPRQHPEELGQALAAELIRRGAEKILDQSKSSAKS
ncbi:MAG: hydroxymethylbilane synthase [Acidobacteriaceae bacterium]|nr:hydroxymethylbilane synthase [Acidobacteriaceae bacterium]MBV9780504.1 hydroxymethylbilane synthase [Acidobacteriaceae bacterium]